jgi:hypothetical protein
MADVHSQDSHALHSCNGSQDGKCDWSRWPSIIPMYFGKYLNAGTRTNNMIDRQSGLLTEWLPKDMITLTDVQDSKN